MVTQVDGNHVDKNALPLPPSRGLKEAGIWEYPGSISTQDGNFGMDLIYLESLSQRLWRE